MHFAQLAKLRGFRSAGKERMDIVGIVEHRPGCTRSRPQRQAVLRDWKLVDSCKSGRFSEIEQPVTRHVV